MTTDSDTTKPLFTLYVNAKREIPLGAVRVRAALGRIENGRTLDAGLFFYYETRAEADAAKAFAEAIPGIDCTIKVDDDHEHPGRGALDGEHGSG